MFTQKTLTYKDETKNFTVVKGDTTLDLVFDDWLKDSGLIESKVKTRNTVIQAGGNCGLYPYLYSKDYANVFTFEPDPRSFFCLANNCKNNKIIKFNTALGDSHQFLKMIIPSEANLGMNRIADILSEDSEKNGYVIYSITIDSLKIPDVSLIHLDIEGYEYEALQGAKETIFKYRPTIVLELTRKRAEIFDFMKEIGYTPINPKDISNVVFVYE